MTKSSFPRAVVDELLAKSGRRCCLCHEFKGGKIEVHHIIPQGEQGPSTADNAIVLCFDCHAEVHAYWKSNPKGRKFTASELRRHRDQWFESYATTSDTQIDYEKLAGELLHQIAQQARPREGAADVGTEELAKAADPDTPARLREALELQAQNREREAIDALYEAFRRDLPPGAKAELHILLGISFLNLSELVEAEGHYRQALDASRAAMTRKYEAATLGNLGLVYRERGDLQRAEEHLKQALYIQREIGDRIGEANQLGNLGNVYADRGDLERAEEHYQAALAIEREIGDRIGEANALANLGLLAARRDQRDEACRLLKKAAAIHDEIGAGGRAPDFVRAALQKLGCE